MYIQPAVVPGYYLVCYNIRSLTFVSVLAVVPGYYLVCYNLGCSSTESEGL